MNKTNPLAIILGLSAFFFIVFLAVAVGTVMSLSPTRTERKLFGNKDNSIGVIEIKGVISESKKAMDQIEGFAEDPLIKAVIIRINSPGGAVAPSQEIYDALKRLAKKKPTYSSMGSLAASGGYYIACGTKKIFANPGTITGSIGVIMQFADASKLMQFVKVNPYNIKTGKFKDIGNPNREMTADEKALLQDMIDNVLGQFRRAVASARGLTMDKVIEVSDGRIFSGEQAKEQKLVDELGGMSETVEAIAKEAGITGKPHLVYAGKKKRGLDRIFGEFEEDDEASSNIGRGGIGSLFHQLLGQAGDGLLDAVSSPVKLVGPLFLLPFAVQ